MTIPESLALRLVEELVRRGYAAVPGPPAGEYGWKIRLEGVSGAIVVYFGKQGPRLVLTELRTPPPELEAAIRKDWERVAAGYPARWAIPQVSPLDEQDEEPADIVVAARWELPSGPPAGTAPVAECVDLWVDGSYVSARRRSAIGWAVLILAGGSELYRATGTDVPAEARSQRNVAGEILAVRHGLSWCREHGVARAVVYHDYEGLEAWVTGRWQARNPFTAAYARWVRESGVTVRWQKVRAHAGNVRNEQVDRLARRAAEAALALPARDEG